MRFVVEGDKVFGAYVIVLENGVELYGLDTRSPEALRQDWLEKHAKGAKSQAAHERAVMRTEIMNDLLFERLRAEDEERDLGFEKSSPKSVPLDEVAAPPADVLDADEVVTLEGLKTGYGTASAFACDVVAICRAWGEFEREICDGAAVRRDTATTGTRKRRTGKPWRKR